MRKVCPFLIRPPIARTISLTRSYQHPYSFDVFFLICSSRETAYGTCRYTSPSRSLLSRLLQTRDLFDLHLLQHTTLSSPLSPFHPFHPSHPGQQNRLIIIVMSRTNAPRHFRVLLLFAFSCTDWPPGTLPYEWPSPGPPLLWQSG